MSRSLDRAFACLFALLVIDCAFSTRLTTTTATTTTAAISVCSLFSILWSIVRSCLRLYRLNDWGNCGNWSLLAWALCNGLIRGGLKNWNRHGRSLLANRLFGFNGRYFNCGYILCTNFTCFNFLNRTLARCFRLNRHGTKSSMRLLKNALM
ncbi:unannotated protein [freshwater metagenome]|uniref:Unannotated protein n=1 Tax=freshwater metagenome TaxID=449393 RepID=A0A6J7VU74_9ZZZZ